MTAKRKLCVLPEHKLRLLRSSHHLCSVRRTTAAKRVRQWFAVFTSLPSSINPSASSAFISGLSYSKEGSPWKRPFSCSACATISLVAGGRRLHSTQFKLSATSTTQENRARYSLARPLRAQRGSHRDSWDAVPHQPPNRPPEASPSQLPREEPVPCPQRR